MTGVHDIDRGPLGKTPLAVAHERSQLIDESIDRHRFMAAFHLGEQYGSGDDGYQEFRRALDAGDSVTVAGLVEGQAATRKDRYQPTLTAERPAPRRAPQTKLTEAQKVTLLDLALGLSVAESARRQGVCPETAFARLRSARKKLHARTNTHAVTIALSRGLLTVADLRGHEPR